jgi:hypothetical protein
MQPESFGCWQRLDPDAPPVAQVVVLVVHGHEPAKGMVPSEISMSV